MCSNDFMFFDLQYQTKHNVSLMDESTILEELLFVKNISVTYDVDSLVISNVGHTYAASKTK